MGKGDPDVRVYEKKIPPRNRAGARGDPAFPIRRDLGGALPHSGLCLRHRAERGEALHKRGAGLPIFPLLEPDRDHVRAAHGCTRRRRGRTRDRDRHGRGDDRADGPGARGRPRGGLEGAVRLLPLYRPGSPAALRRLVDPGRRLRPRAVAQGGAAEHQDVLPGEPDQPGARSARHQGDRRDRARGRRHAGGRQRVLDAAVPEAARARRRLRGLFRDQAHRRPGPLSRRRRARLGEVHPGSRADLDPPDRPVAFAVQRLGAAEGARDVGGARAPADRHRRDHRSRAFPAPQDLAADLSRTARSSAGRDRAPADARRLDPRRLRGQGRQGGCVPLPGCAASRAHQQQSRRRQEPDHAPRHDHPPAPDARGARRARHQRRPGAPVMRPRACRRPGRGPDDRAEGSVRGASYPARRVGKGAWRDARSEVRSIVAPCPRVAVLPPCGR